MENKSGRKVGTEKCEVVIFKCDIPLLIIIILIYFQAIWLRYQPNHQQPTHPPNYHSRTVKNNQAGNMLQKICEVVIWQVKLTFNYISFNILTNKLAQVLTQSPSNLSAPHILH